MLKKLILAFLGLIVVLAVALFLFGSSLLNKGIKKGVETIGPKVTQTAVTLDAVDISIFSGSGSLKGLNIANPQGYKSEYIFALGEIDVGIEIGSLMSDTIMIDRVIIRKPEISYETNLSTSNVKELLKNIEEFTGSSESAPATSEESPAEETAAGKKVIIKQVLVEDGTVYVGILGAGQAINLPRIELTNVGENNSVTIVQATNIIIQEILKAIGPAISENGGKSLLEGDGSAIKKVSEGLKGLFDK